MAQSRYAQVGLTPVRQYADEPTFEGPPSRVDLVLLGRYTSWAPATGSIVYTVEYGDRLPDIARKLYGNPQLWWILADFNPKIFYPLELEEGQTLICPPANLVAQVTGG